MAEDKSKSRLKRKKWVSFKTSPAFGEKSIGETHVLDPKLALGRTIEVNAMTLLGDPRKQHINLFFKGVHLDGATSVKCETTGYAMVPSSLKRLVRRNKDKIDDSYLLQSKDGKIFRIKPILVTNTNTTRSVRTQLRKRTFETIARETRKMQFEVIIQDILAGKLQKFVREQLIKIYPLRVCDIRVLKIETSKKNLRAFKPVEIKDEVVKEEKKKTKKSSASETKDDDEDEVEDKKTQKKESETDDNEEKEEKSVKKVSKKKETIANTEAKEEKSDKKSSATDEDTDDEQ